MLVLNSVLCLNHSIEAIIDTGSGVTVFSPQLCKLLHLPVVKWSGPPVLLADGKRAHVEGTVDTAIEDN